MHYIWNNEDWPRFSFDEKKVNDKYIKYVYQKGLTDQIFNMLTPEGQKECYSNAISNEIVSSNEIEGISISYESVYSSVLRALKVENTKPVKDKNAEVLASLSLSIHSDLTPITEEKILSWHRLILENSQKQTKGLNAGHYREKTVYVMKFSGKLDEEVLYEAIPYEDVEVEMKKLVAWINETTYYPAVVRSAVASLWLLSIHPFSDGNGRISRLLSYAIMRDEGILRYMSTSSVILERKKEYYDELYKAQHSTSMDITMYILWFIDMVIDGMKKTENICKAKIKLSSFMASLDPGEYNSRELSMLYRLASSSFMGKLTGSKWCKMTKCQSATATRDLAHLCEKNILIKSEESGRSSWYALNPKIKNSAL